MSPASTPLTRRPAAWIALALLSIASAAIGVRYFPVAFSILALDITMDRTQALDAARAIAVREGLGPSGFHQAASFGGDQEAQTFVELEGGGKEAFTRMLREPLYSAYAWRVRHYKEGETNESTIEFTPDGRPYGFVEKLREDAPGAALDTASAKAIAERTAGERWNVDLARFTPVEQGQERRPSGRVDHTFTYERRDATLNEGRYRLTLTVAGDRLSGVDHFVKIPEAFTRRYASMRSNNELIGIGSTVGLAVLYVIGGIGIGLFFMMRQRSILWRTAAIWGFVVGALQTLAAINELPLIWMGYDTAVPRATFLAQQAAFLTAGFFGFSAFFSLSFIAAETLSRRAFGHHPQLWRSWGRDEGASVQILGHTISGYLLVSVFFAYDVLLYVVMTRVFGWWSPAEALVHPDVLATYAPWLSAIANSFQAGFWEEALFRAVPIAGAALIGERLGHRRLFIVIAFVVQALIFGGGHAPYPNQPAYARPVELILPSIGFGLLYLYFGLLPGIILHFAFDVVWFALPIFMARTPGIWVQQLLVIVFTLVPLWVVLWRRAQAGRWMELPDSSRNAAWTPPPVTEAPVEVARPVQHALPGAARTAWLAVGGLSLLVVIGALTMRQGRNSYGALPVSRGDAEAIARNELQRRGADLSSKWRVMAVPDDGRGGPHQYVYESAGAAAWRELLGVYLPKPRWRVRVATFEGDVADRAEEWLVFVGADGAARNVQHVIPQDRAGASLDERAARVVALAAIKERADLDQSRLKEISAKPSKEKARTDWTFTFRDSGTTAVEARLDVRIAGDEVVAVSRYVHVPEEWERQQRAASTRDLIVQIASSVIFGGVIFAAAIGGLMAWSRGRYTPRLFLIAAALVLAASGASLANSWPALLANLQTTAPLQLQILGLLAITAVGLALLAATIGLAVGACPARLADVGRIDRADALPLGIAAGLFAAAVGAAASALRTPEWARFPAIDATGTIVPSVDMAIDAVPAFMIGLAVMTAAVLSIDRLTHAWTHRRWIGIAGLAAIGLLAGGAPAGSGAGGWAMAGLITAVALVIAYTTLLRFDPTLIPLALGTAAVIRGVSVAIQRPFPGAVFAGLLAAVLAAALAFWWFRLLRVVYSSVPGTAGPNH